MYKHILLPIDGSRLSEDAAKMGIALARSMGSRGARYVEGVREAARRSGVPCECSVSHGQTPHEGILAEARRANCDLIVMASHGRGGSAEELLDSETVKVMMLGDTPVLLHHARRDRDRRTSA